MLTAEARVELLSQNGEDRRNGNLTVTKRNGDVVPFDITRIERAMLACMADDLSYALDKAEPIAKSVAKQVKNLLCFEKQPVGVEVIQNLVEAQLMAYGYYDVAKQYILFRDDKRRLRESAEIPDAVVEAFKANDKYFYRFMVLTAKMSRLWQMYSVRAAFGKR